jgi:hypothetical protein
MARSDGNYFVIRGYMDGMIMGERSFDTQQEAEFYGKRMLDHMKSQYPKAKKIAVDIDSTVKHAPGPKIKTLASRPGKKDMMASENEVRLQLKGGRSIKIVRTETPTGGMWSIPEMPEIAAHQNISVIRDRLRGKGLIACRPGEKDMMATRKPKVREKWETVFYEYFHGVPVSIMDSGKIKNDINAILASGADLKVEMPKLVKKYGRFSRPGAKATFKVEDRFYFGKGRKERFAITRQPGSCLYANNTGTDVSGYHSAIAKAIEKGGKFDSDFSDVFKLTRSPAGSVCLWSLTWA